MPTEKVTLLNGMKQFPVDVSTVALPRRAIDRIVVMHNRRRGTPRKRTMKRLILTLSLVSLVSLACGASAALPSAIPAPSPEHAVYYQAVGDVNIRETPDGTVLGVLHTGDKVQSAGVVVRLDGVRWCKHELGWSACEWLRLFAPVRGAYQNGSVKAIVSPLWAWKGIL